MFICLSSATIRNRRMKLGTTWVSQGVLQMPKVRNIPRISSMTNSMSANRSGFQAARYFFCAAWLNMLMAMNPATIERTTVASCVMPYIQSYGVNAIVHLSLLQMLVSRI